MRSTGNSSDGCHCEKRRNGVASGGGCGARAMGFILLGRIIKTYVCADGNNKIERGNC